MTFGERLKRFRDEMGLTMAQLGQGLGEAGGDVSKQTVNGWEKGKHYPKVDQLVLLCKKLHKTADELVFGHDSPTDMKTLNGLEGNLIYMYRQIPETLQDDVLGYVNDLLSKNATVASPAAPFANAKSGRAAQQKSVKRTDHKSGSKT